MQKVKQKQGDFDQFRTFYNLSNENISVDLLRFQYFPSNSDFFLKL